MWSQSGSRDARQLGLRCKFSARFSKEFKNGSNFLTIFLPTETIIYHHFLSKTDAENCEPKRCATHSVTHDVSMDQIINCTD